MKFETCLSPDIKGDKAIALVQISTSRLFNCQKNMTIKAKNIMFSFMTKYVPGGLDQLEYQIDSFRLFGFLRDTSNEQKTINNWLVPEPGSILTQLLVNKVIITHDLKAIPVSEVFTYEEAQHRATAIQSLYERSSGEFLPVLYHKGPHDQAPNLEQMLKKIHRIVDSAPRFPLLPI